MRTFWFWLTHNASSAHHRWLARYLKRQGWVVFYLEPRARECGRIEHCWMRLYVAQEGYVKPGPYLHHDMPPVASLSADKEP